MTQTPFQPASRKMKALLLLSGLTLLAACSQPKAPDYESKVNATILQSYKALAAKSDEFKTAAAECKSSPTLETMNSLKPYWENTMAAWQDIQWVSFGPVSESSRQWQLEFWPDQKNIIGRKMNTLLAADEVTQDDLKKSGAIVQGLTALEYLMFDPSAQTNDPAKSCHLTQLITTSLADTTQKIAAEWAGFGKEQLAQSKMQAEKSDKPDAATEYTSQLLSAQLSQLNIVVHKKLENPLALSLTDEAAAKGNNAASLKKSLPNPYFLESWRSEQSYDNVTHNYQSLKTFLVSNGFIQHLKDKEHTAVAENIEKRLQKIDSLIASEPYFSLSLVQSNKWDKDNSQALFKELHDLNKVLAKDTVNALGVLVSFNATDGDF